MAKDEGTFWVDEESGELVLDNQGEEERFYIDEEMEVGNSKYLVLIPTIEEAADEALVLKLIEEDGEQILSIIEDDDEFDRVKESYLQQNN